MNRPGPSPQWLLALVLLVAACQPKIGDSCATHANCSSTGGRLCEPNFPGGYCTVFNCEPGTCPDEAVCVAYGAVLSPRTACADPGQDRLERTFCMKTCSSNSDCRSGYACLDLYDPNPWGAEVVEQGSRANTKVCGLSVSGAAAAVDMAGSTAVCTPPPDASFPEVPTVGAPEGGLLDAGGDAAPLLLEAGPDTSKTSGVDAALRDAAPEAAP